MARTVRNPKIDTRSAQREARRRREPYWTVISADARSATGSGAKGGTWIGQFRGDEGRQHLRRSAPPTMPATRTG